jgi:parallel beta-helix repeat protein
VGKQLGPRRSLVGVKVVSFGLTLAVVLVSCAAESRPQTSPAFADHQLEASIASAEPATAVVLDVRGFGARGDGGADDTAAIQRAIRAAPAGATVFFPAGTYRIGSAPLLLKSNLRLLGSGRASTLHESTGNRSILSINDAENVTVEGLHFTGSGTRIVAGRGAIWAAIGKTYGTHNSRFINNFIEGVGTSGIVVGNSSGTVVAGNTISGALEHGIYVSVSSDTTVANNLITQVGAADCGACAGIKLANALRARIERNVISSPSHDGILFESGTTDSEATANKLSDVPQSGIRVLAGATRIRISRNVFTNVRGPTVLIPERDGESAGGDHVFLSSLDLAVHPE